MEGMFLFVFLTAVLAAVGLAAQTWGVDSRDGSDDPRRSKYPVSIQ
jgi:nitrogen fixation-related uncharacterized protein